MAKRLLLGASTIEIWIIRINKINILYIACARAINKTCAKVCGVF